MTSLDDLLDRIDPIHTLDEDEARINAALNSFPFREGLIERWDDFEPFMARLFHHLECSIRDTSNPARTFDHQFAWWRCHDMLKDAYGYEGEKVAFELARTGNEGGLYAVVKKLARTMVKEYAKRGIEARVHHWLKQLSPDEQIAAAREYLEKYGHLLSSELTEGSAARVLVNFDKVLIEHPRLMQRLRRVGR